MTTPSKLILSLVFVASLYLGVYIVRVWIIPKLTHYEVNSEVLTEVKKLYGEFGKYSEGIARIWDDKNNKLLFADKIILLRSENIEWVENDITMISSKNRVNVSSDNGRTWRQFTKEDSDFCYYAVVANNKLVCLAGKYLYVFSEDGILVQEKQLVTANTNELFGVEPILMYKEGPEWIFVWRDQRARTPTLLAFIPTPYSGDVYTGPYMIMAGKLNLDTLDFKEYVIGYNASKLEDIGIKPKE